MFLLTPVAGLVVRFASRLLGIEKPPEPESYSQRLTKLTQELTRASSEVDGLLAELAQVARDKENTVQELGSHLVELEQKEIPKVGLKVRFWKHQDPHRNQCHNRKSSYHTQSQHHQDMERTSL